MASLAAVINDMIISALLNAQVTSANPEHVNRITGIVNASKGELDWDAVDAALAEAIKDSAKTGTEKDDTNQDESQEQILAKIFKGDTAKAGELLEYVTNPQNKIMSLMTTAGPAGILFGSILVAAFKSDEIMELIIDQLTQPGAPFDRRLKIFVEEGVNAFFTRMEQRRRGIGQDQVIMTQVDGFGNAGGFLTVNTLTEVKATGISRLGVHEHALGMN